MLNFGSTADFQIRSKQSGPIVYRQRSILREPGNARAYRPGSHAPGTKVKFVKGVYVVGLAGNLLRASTT